MTEITSLHCREYSTSRRASKRNIAVSSRRDSGPIMLLHTNISILLHIKITIAHKQHSKQRAELLAKRDTSLTLYFKDAIK